MPLDPLRADDPTELGRWTLEGRLGAGGMGVVYLASAPDGTRVALKLVRADLADDPMFRARFRREVDAVRRVRGDRVARLIEADADADQPYLVVEFVDGPTLNQAVTEAGPMRGERLVAFAAALAEAVVSIHQAGVVHRDLKPSNVLLTADAPKVVDFGVASSAEATAITQAGMVLGSPGWMAPEQLTGGATSPAIDVFTWASLVTYTGTGIPPFGEGRFEAIAYRIVHERPNLGSLEPPLRDLVLEAFATEPDQRPSMEDLLARLVHQTADDPTQLAASTTRLLAEDWRMPSMMWVPVPPTPAYARVAAMPGDGGPGGPVDGGGVAVVPPPAPPEPAAPGRRWTSWVAGIVAFLTIATAGVLLTLWWANQDDDETAAETTTTTEPPTTTTTLPPIGDVQISMTVEDNLRRVPDEACESAAPYDDISWRFDDAETGERLAFTSTIDQGVAVPGDQDVFGGLVDDVLGRNERPTFCVYSGVIPQVPNREGYVLVSSIPGDDTDEIGFTQDDLEAADLTIDLAVEP